MNNNKPVKTEYRLQPLVRIMMALCLAGIICSGVIWYLSSREYDRENSAYRDIQAAQKTAETGGAPSKEAGVDFTTLAAINDEIAAWLTADDGIINYPVAHGSDNIILS